MASTTLGSKSAGDIVYLKENGTLVPFYVAKQNYESGLNGSGRTLLVRQYIYDTRVWHSSNVNAWASSSIYTWLNGTYKALFDSDIQEAMSTTKYYYTPGNGTTTVTSMSSSVFLLSLTELGRTSSYANTEGTALGIASTLQIAYTSSGSATTQWTRSLYTNSTTNVWRLSSGGGAGGYNCSGSGGARPAFTLPSSLSVSDDGSVSVNTAPTISSGTTSGSDLGTKTEGFNLTYTVADAESDTVTVSEYLDDVLQRSYTVTLGATNTFQAVTAANWQTVLNGSHTLKIIANDGTEDSDTYSVTFTKKVTTATITLTDPLTADDDIAIMVMTLAGSLPDDADLTILVTNNANDSSPVWEDATDDILNGANYIFENTTAENGFAFNFKLTVSRGSSDTGGYISGIGGAFE